MKGFIKLIIYFFAFIFQHCKLSRVIYYHDCGTLFTEMGTDMKLIQRHYQIAINSGFQYEDEITAVEKQLMMCFDDGWAGIYDNRQFFIERNIHPTIFIAVDLIGKDGYLSIEQIKDLMSYGFKFESHTWTHTGLPEHKGEDLKRELKGAKLKLEEIFDKPFDAICFPQGRFSNEVISECENAGYKELYSSIAGCFCDLKDKGLICRNLVQTMSPLQFFLMVNSNSRIMQKRMYKLHFQI